MVKVCKPSFSQWNIPMFFFQFFISPHLYIWWSRKLVCEPMKRCLSCLSACCENVFLLHDAPILKFFSFLPPPFPGPHQTHPLPSDGRSDLHRREEGVPHLQAVSAGGVWLQQGARQSHPLRQTHGGETAGQQACACSSTIDHNLNPLCIYQLLSLRRKKHKIPMFLIKG